MSERPNKRGRIFDIRNIRRDVDADLSDELTFHFESAVEELMRAGLSEPQARAEAARRFGDRDRYVRELRQTDRATIRWEGIRQFVGDSVHALRQVMRGLLRSPGFALTATLTLALGIGANATMFGIVDRLLLRAPDHIQEPDRVRRLIIQRAARRGTIILGNSHSFPDVGDWKSARTIQSLAAYSPWGEMTMGRGAQATRVRATLAQAALFPTLGVQARFGRFYGADEDRIGGESVVVLGYDLWRSAFGSDPGVLGQSIMLGGRTFTIVGVAPPGFTGVDLARTDIWLPLEKVGFELEGNATDSRNDWWLNAVVRLADNTTVEQAEAELTALHRAGRAAQRDSYDPEARVLAASVIAARGPEGSTPATVAMWLAGVSLIVLLIACANVANLFLARASQRRREIAIRLSLGIPRRRLMFMVLTESVLLALLAASAATVLAAWGGSVVRATLLPDVHWTGVGIDLRIGLVTLVVTLIAGLLAGVAPALASSNADVTEALRTGDGRSTVRRGKVRSALLVIQPALSVLLLVGAGLFVRSLSEVRGIDLGFEPKNLYAIGLETENPAPDLYDRAARRLSQLPMVVQASTAFGMPFRNSWAEEFRAAGIDSLPEFPNGGPYLNAVSPAFLRTMGIDIRRGRGIEATDAAGTLPVVVLSEYLAMRLWPDDNPLGRCVFIGETPDCTTVVGIAENAHRQTLIEEPEALYYIPEAQNREKFPARVLFVRVRPGGADVRMGLRQELEGLDSGIRYASVRSYEALIDPQARAWTLGASMFTLFGVLALAVAALGIYSVFVFDVSRRVPEIGIRGALGASTGQIVRLVLFDVAKVSGIGLALGLIAAVFAAPLLAPLLYNVSPRDPLVLSIVAITLAVVALGAGALPALRATRVDPNVALRTE